MLETKPYKTLELSELFASGNQVELDPKTILALVNKKNREELAELRQINQHTTNSNSKTQFEAEDVKFSEEMSHFKHKRSHLSNTLHGQNHNELTRKFLHQNSGNTQQICSPNVNRKYNTYSPSSSLANSNEDKLKTNLERPGSFKQERLSPDSYFCRRKESKLERGKVWQDNIHGEISELDDESRHDEDLAKDRTFNSLISGSFDSASVTITSKLNQIVNENPSDKVNLLIF